ncbi:MAG: phosphoadenosine phosphosulfate reductase domain-containing protein [Candidatus Helarchaeota archaeon]
MLQIENLNTVKTCKNCLNSEYHDTRTMRHIKIGEDGLCDLCKQDLLYRSEFFQLRKRVRDDLPRIFEKVKKEKHEYDAILWLSGGKDSSVALILAKERYNLNILAFTIDRGNLFAQTRKNIDNLTNHLGVDHIYFRTPPKIFRNLLKFGISTMSRIGICCTVCGSLMHRPITSRLLMNHDIPLVITGVDLWEIYGAFLDQKWREQKNKKQNEYNQFFQYLPQFNELVNDYEAIITMILRKLRLHSKDPDHFKTLRDEFLQIIEPMKRWWLNEEEKKKFKEINQKIKYIPLTAIEITKKSELFKLLDKYGWKLPKLPSGEIIGTDCRAGNLFNAISSFKSKSQLWAYRIISGNVTKQEAIEEIKKPVNVELLKEILDYFEIENLENRLKLGWNSPYYRDLFNLKVIESLQRND